VYGLRLVDEVLGINHSVKPKTPSLAGRPLVVVEFHGYSRKGFSVGGVAEVVNDYTEVIKDQASAINLSLMDSRVILELKHISHNKN